MPTVPRVSKLGAVVAAIPYILLGWPWFALFRDPWFHGGGLTVEQLETGPGYAVAYSVAIVSSLVMAYVLSLVVVGAGAPSAARGAGVGLAMWLGFIAPLLATQYTFEARSLAYFGITAGYPLVGLLLMGAIVGRWNRRSE